MAQYRWNQSWNLLFGTMRRQLKNIKMRFNINTNSVIFRRKEDNSSSCLEASSSWSSSDSRSSSCDFALLSTPFRPESESKKRRKQIHKLAYLRDKCCRIIPLQLAMPCHAYADSSSDQGSYISHR